MTAIKPELDIVMEFLTEDDAKNYSISITAQHTDKDGLESRLKEYNKYLDSANESDKDYWREEIQKLEEWINSEKFKNGDYPRGLDELVLELVEWNAVIYAFQKVDIKNDPFKKHAFYAQWLVGGTYTIFCLLGKLVSNDDRDNSLRKIWNMFSGYISKSGLCAEGEVDYINKKMHKKNGQFTNVNSQAILYRNKVVAHNECLPTLEWSELNKDIELIVRIWALITMWSSFGIIEPFRKPEQVFSGTESVFSPSEIRLLLAERSTYLKQVKDWATKSVNTGERVSPRSPFGSISISFAVSEINT